MPLESQDLFKLVAELLLRLLPIGAHSQLKKLRGLTPQKVAEKGILVPVPGPPPCTMRPLHRAAVRTIADIKL